MTISDMEESTLDSDLPTHQPTNQQSKLMEYVSFRLTAPHSKWDHIVEVVLIGFDWYIGYPHIGKNGNNEHFHVAVPGNKIDAERIRKRIKTGGFHGNKCFSVKCMQNSIASYITYAAREKTEPLTRGPVEQWIADAPVWVDANLLDNLNPNRATTKARKGAIMLTSARMLYQVWRWRQDRKRFDMNNIGDCIMNMLGEMDDEGEPKYILSPEWCRRPMPTFFLEVFKDSCAKGCITFRKTQAIWMDVLFKDARI